MHEVKHWAEYTEYSSDSFNPMSGLTTFPGKKMK